MRTHQHITDTRSIRRVLNLLPDHWVIRDLTERDYGIDLTVEVFEKNGINIHGDTYSSTGAMFHIQVKGTASKLKHKRGRYISFPLDKGAIEYASQFNVPFLLFLVDISSQDAKSYFLWIQRYVRDFLDLKSPGWRTGTQNSFSVQIPLHNEISSRYNKIEKIASRPCVIQEMVDFNEIYSNLSRQLNAISIGNLDLNNESLKNLKILAMHIYNLKMIYKYNDCCINKDSAQDLLEFVNSLDLKTEKSTFSKSPHQYHFSLLVNSLYGVTELENFIAENDGETVY
ncbi:uncharacterized protein DUF4365 [Methylovorus glucosotrophus]|uniref:DUF4365 domain-containing protein n=1 Tax=Methylovorus glucosotrophus TaxID=266009 RepID=UPI0013319753|nr:DUF4365 domain-containing protein [Methylovorus glucosotrophus]KAF0844154.1 uncharacterized protein DUF4365 [Methylovorus glucosotrophus]